MWKNGLTSTVLLAPPNGECREQQLFLASKPWVTLSSCKLIYDLKIISSGTDRPLKYMQNLKQGIYSYHNCWVSWIAKLHCIIDKIIIFNKKWDTFTHLLYVPVLVDKRNSTLQQKSSQSLVVKKKVMVNDIRLECVRVTGNLTLQKSQNISLLLHYVILQKRCKYMTTNQRIRL